MNTDLVDHGIMGKIGFLTELCILYNQDIHGIGCSLQIFYSSIQRVLIFYQTEKLKLSKFEIIL